MFLSNGVIKPLKAGGHNKFNGILGGLKKG